MHNNLIPLNQRTKNEQRVIAQKGGIASGKARRETKKMREILENLMEIKTPDGRYYKEAICLALADKALEGNVKAFETICKTLGEDPNKYEEAPTKIQMPNIIIQPVRPFSPNMDTDKDNNE